MESEAGKRHANALCVVVSKSYYRSRLKSLEMLLFASRKKKTPEFPLKGQEVPTLVCYAQETLSTQLYEFSLS